MGANLETNTLSRCVLLHLELDLQCVGGRGLTFCYRLCSFVFGRTTICFTTLSNFLRIYKFDHEDQLICLQGLIELKEPSPR